MPGHGKHTGQLWRFLLGALLILSCVACLSCKAIDGLIARAEIRKWLRQPAQSPPARLEVYGRVPVVHVYGTPREMGSQYGTLLGRPLRALGRVMHAFLSEPTRRRMLDFARTREAHLPGDIRQELRAISETSGMPYDELVALNVTPRLACSALAMWGEARSRGDDPNAAGLIMGRNADYFSMGFSDRGMMVVVYHPRDGHAVASVNFLGMIGAFTGVNDRGVAFGNMLVFNAAGAQQQDDGLTIQLALRLAAQRSATAQEMADLLASQPHAIPMNVMVADRTEALVTELGLGDVNVRRGRRGVLAASNYFLMPRLRTRDRKCRRYDSLLAAAGKHRGRMTVRRMKAALYKARIPCMNLQAVIFEPAAMRMHVSINRSPAARGPYVQFDLKKLFAQPPLRRRPTPDRSRKPGKQYCVPDSQVDTGIGDRFGRLILPLNSEPFSGSRSRDSYSCKSIFRNDRAFAAALPLWQLLKKQNICLILPTKSDRPSSISRSSSSL